IPRMLPFWLRRNDAGHAQPTTSYIAAEKQFAGIADADVRAGVAQMAANRKDSRLQWLFRHCVYLLLVILCYAVIVRRSARFIAQKIFLLDVDEAVWMQTGTPLRPILGDHILLTHWPDTPLDSLITLDRFRPIDMTTVVKTSVADLLRSIDCDREKHHLLLTGFAVSVVDPEHAAERLQFLERLATLPERTIVIATEVTPMMILTTLGDIPTDGPKLRAGCETLLTRFLWLVDGSVKAAKNAH